MTNEDQKRVSLDNMIYDLYLITSKLRVVYSMLTGIQGSLELDAGKKSSGITNLDMKHYHDEITKIVDILEPVISINWKLNKVRPSLEGDQDHKPGFMLLKEQTTPASGDVLLLDGDRIPIPPQDSKPEHPQQLRDNHQESPPHGNNLIPDEPRQDMHREHLQRQQDRIDEKLVKRLQPEHRTAKLDDNTEQPKP